MVLIKTSLIGLDNKDEKRAIEVNGSTIVKKIEFCPTSNISVKGGCTNVTPMLLSALLFIFFIYNISLFADEYKITIKNNGNGTATCIGTEIGYDSITTCYQIQAFPDKGYMFSYWSNSDGDSISNYNPYLVIPTTSDTVLIANFTKAPGDYLVSVGGGGFTYSGGGYYNEGDTAILTASLPPSQCYEISHWMDRDSNFISAENPLEIIVVSDTTLFVNLKSLQYFVTIERFDSQGMPLPADTIAYCGKDSVITVEAFPDEGYMFLNWTNKNGNVISEENPWTIAGIHSDTILIPNFVLVNNIEIKESFIKNIKISPNPTKETTELTLDLVTPGSLNIILIDLLGKELLQIHNNFEDAGTFSKTLTTISLPVGVYILKISHNGNTIIEKISVKE